ncbi:MAG: exodeoxyribonuclease VII large subunit, partial [Prevotella sp.]|nr:exodeoxyribonuclease VII large subunit [Prevotella sp.]
MPAAHVTLYELNGLVKEVISNSLPDEYWVEAELSELRENSGNCYMELVEKQDGTNTPIAKASAKCWRSTWFSVRSHFERVTGQRLHSGLKVLLCVYAQFHENYGFSWIVTD